MTIPSLLKLALLVAFYLLGATPLSGAVNEFRRERNMRGLAGEALGLLGQLFSAVKGAAVVGVSLAVLTMEASLSLPSWIGAGLLAGVLGELFPVSSVASGSGAALVVGGLFLIDLPSAVVAVGVAGLAVLLSLTVPAMARRRIWLLPVVTTLAGSAMLMLRLGIASPLGRYALVCAFAIALHHRLAGLLWFRRPTV